MNKPLTDVLPIEIGRHESGEPYAVITKHDGHVISLVHGDLDALARDDGFNNAEKMFEWFSDQHGLPFNGFLHLWE